MNAILVGAAGEKAACNYLKKNKYKILDKNYRKPFGEIDLIARRGETVSFIEVKTRRSTEFGLPCEAVTYAKRRRLIRTAYAYIEETGLDANYSFDVIEAFHEDGKIKSVRHIQNAFGVE